MMKHNLTKVAMQLYLNHISLLMFFFILTAYFQNTSWHHLWTTVSNVNKSQKRQP